MNFKSTNMKSFVHTTTLLTVFIFRLSNPLYAQVPDLTKDAATINRELTYNWPGERRG
jgi:hypothetical protein